MTHLDESQMEVHRPTSLCTTKDSIYIGSWNVRSMCITGKRAQIEKKFDRYRLDIFGLREVKWSMIGKPTLQSGKLMLYSGREDELHLEGIGIMLTKKVKKSLMEWKPINERMMYARLCLSR